MFSTSPRLWQLKLENARFMLDQQTFGEHVNDGAQLFSTCAVCQRGSASAGSNIATAQNCSSGACKIHLQLSKIASTRVAQSKSQDTMLLPLCYRVATFVVSFCYRVVLVLSRRPSPSIVSVGLQSCCQVEPVFTFVTAWLCLGNHPFLTQEAAQGAMLLVPPRHFYLTGPFVGPKRAARRFGQGRKPA